MGCHTMPVAPKGVREKRCKGMRIPHRDVAEPTPKGKDDDRIRRRGEDVYPSGEELNILQEGQKNG